jgi:hypothetical protein
MAADKGTAWRAGSPQQLQGRQISIKLRHLQRAAAPGLARRCRKPPEKRE